MLNLSLSSNYFDDIPHSVIGDLLPSCSKSRLPRHVSALESSNHGNICPSLFKAVQKCPLKQQPYSETAINAVNILQYQLQDSASQRQHLENVRSNLLRRLKVAQSAKNTQLVTMLESEFRQLEVNI